MLFATFKPADELINIGFDVQADRCKSSNRPTGKRNELHRAAQLVMVW